MDQRVSLITLGVRDLATARSFYEELGWKTGAGPDDDVVFFQTRGLVVALWDRDRLAEDSCIDHDEGGWGGVTLAYNVGSPAEVDAVIEEARSAGARIPRAGAATLWASVMPPQPPGSCTPLSSARRARSHSASTMPPAWKNTTSSAGAAPVFHPSCS